MLNFEPETSDENKRRPALIFSNQSLINSDYKHSQFYEGKVFLLQEVHSETKNKDQELIMTTNSSQWKNISIEQWETTNKDHRRKKRYLFRNKIVT